MLSSMAMEWCEGCGNLANVGDLPYCSNQCKQTAQRRYLGQSLETRDRPAPPPPRMLSVREGYLALGDQTLGPAEAAQRNATREADMVARLALHGGRFEKGKRAATPAPLEIGRDTQAAGFTRHEQKLFEGWLKIFGA